MPETIFKKSRKIAKKLNLHPHSVYLILKKKRPASFPLAVKIEEVTGGEGEVAA